MRADLRQAAEGNLAGAGAHTALQGVAPVQRRDPASARAPAEDAAERRGARAPTRSGSRPLGHGETIPRALDAGPARLARAGATSARGSAVSAERAAAAPAPHLSEAGSPTTCLRRSAEGARSIATHAHLVACAGGRLARGVDRASRPALGTIKHLLFFGCGCNVRYMPAVPASRPLAAVEILQRLRTRFEALSPELQRAARWIADHPSEAGLLSMRQQARSAGVSAPTMIRLARALGLADYASLRHPFQQALTGRAIDY